MMIKKLFVGIGAAALTIATSTAALAAPLKLTDGDTIKLNAGIGNAFGGGAFKVTGVSVLNGTGDSFYTFCIEYPEHIAYNTNYFVDLNNGAVNGGFSTAGTYAGDVNGGGTFDPLSNATAWLYKQYRTNTSALNRVGDTFVNDAAHNNSMQLAIWKLENELGANASAVTAYNGDQRAKDWVAKAIAMNNGWNHGVRVLNLYDTYNAQTHVFSGRHQDQLYLAPVPEPETYAMMLAGLGLIGYVAGRRRRKLG